MEGKDPTTLAYSDPPMRPLRPALLTAVAVVGLMVACIGFVVSGLGIRALPAQWAAVGRPIGIPLGVPPAPSVLPPYAGDVFARNGLARADRQLILNAAADPSLTSDRRALLDRLLGEFGRIAFPNAPTDLGITSVGHLPSGPDGLGNRGTTVIRTATGVLWADDAEARFQRPSDRGMFETMQDRATDSAGKVTHSAVAVADSLDALHARLGPAFNNVQAAVVAAELLAAPPTAKADGRFFDHSSPNPDGSTRFDPLWLPQMDGRTLTYGDAPRTLVLWNGAKLVDTGNLDPATGLPVPRQGPPKLALLTQAVVTGLSADAIVGVVLAGWLVFAAIGLLRDRRVAPAGIVRWAWAKGIAVATWFAFNLAVLLPRMLVVNVNPPPGFVQGYVVGLTVVIALQVAFPVAVLIVLRSMNVQTYLAELQASVDVLPDPLRHRLTPGIRRAIAGPLGRVATAFTIVAALALAGLQLRGVVGRGPVAVDPYWFETRGFRAVATLGCLASALLAAMFWRIRSEHVSEVG